jgi:hypothetical protein
VTLFQEFDDMVSRSIEECHLNSKKPLSAEMRQILCGVVFAGYDLFPGKKIDERPETESGE